MSHCARPSAPSSAAAAFLDAADMKAATRLLRLPTTLLLVLAGAVAAGDTITAGKIKVQLFAAPSFLSEVSVDAYNNQCLSLDNNLYVCAQASLCRPPWR